MFSDFKRVILEFEKTPRLRSVKSTKTMNCLPWKVKPDEFPQFEKPSYKDEQSKWCMKLTIDSFSLGIVSFPSAYQVVKVNWNFNSHSREILLFEPHSQKRREATSSRSDELQYHKYTSPRYYCDKRFILQFVLSRSERVEMLLPKHSVVSQLGCRGWQWHQAPRAPISQQSSSAQKGLRLVHPWSENRYQDWKT